jgi:protoporphyrinogen oxidase
VLLERYYHHLFTTDRHIRGLYEELGMDDPIEWLPSSTAFFVRGRSWPFTSPLDLLRFKPLPPLSRIRMGLAVLKLQRGPDDVTPYERITIKEWIQRAMGPAAWNVVWGPLLKAKFGDRADDIAMSWLWKKFMIRRQFSDKQTKTEVLGYPRGTWQPLFERLRDEIDAHGGRVLIDRPVARLAREEGGGFRIDPGAQGSFRRGHDPRKYDAEVADGRYGAVVATVPNDVFEHLLDPPLAAEVGGEYLGRLRSIEYHAALCLVLSLDRRFTPFYWTNIADDLPFIGLIEQTNWAPPEHYGGRRLLYVTNYLEPADPLLDLGLDGLLDHYEDGLKRVRPDFERSWIRDAWLFREPNAQPIVDVGYRDRIPALRTPAEGLLLANTTQVYPEDRGTNYAVRIGEDAARALLAGRGAEPTMAP